MKKLFIIMMLSLIGMVSYSQNSLVQNASLGYDATYRVDPLSSSDYIGTGDSVWFYNIQKQTKGKVQLSFRVAYDSIGGTADSVLTTIRHKKWLKAPYTSDTTFVYYGSSDTAVSMELSTEVVADYWQLLIQGYSDSFQMLIDSVYFKFTE